MRGATSNNVIVPQAEVSLQVSTIQEGKWISVCCYYSPEFTSTLLSDNDVLNSNKILKGILWPINVGLFYPTELSCGLSGNYRDLPGNLHIYWI